MLIKGLLGATTTRAGAGHLFREPWREPTSLDLGVTHLEHPGPALFPHQVFLQVELSLLGHDSGRRVGLGHGQEQAAQPPGPARFWR